MFLFVQSMPPAKEISVHSVQTSFSVLEIPIVHRLVHQVPPRPFQASSVFWLKTKKINTKTDMKTTSQVREVVDRSFYAYALKYNCFYFADYTIEKVPRSK